MARVGRCYDPIQRPAGRSAARGPGGSRLRGWAERGGGGAAPEAGFWLGLWHGIIAPVTFVISLFTDDVSIYEVHNSGNWYDFGYVLGLAMAFGGTAGSGSAAGRRRERSTTGPKHT